MISTPNLSNATSEKQAGRSLSEDIDSTANEPPGDSFIRYMSASRRHKRMLYVEFFGPLVEHAWVIEANVLAYPGGDPFEFFKGDDFSWFSYNSVSKNHLLIDFNRQKFEIFIKSYFDISFFMKIY